MVFFASYSVSAQTNNDEGLNPRQQAIVNISSLTAIGDLEKLKPALNAGLDAGLTVNEVKEVLMHLYAYCGFPRSLQGIQTFMAVLDERKAKGINDNLGRTATPIKDKRSKYERGKENLGKLTKQPQDGPLPGYAKFAPEIDVFLKEHLFADLFDRDVLTYAERELVTVSVNASIGGVEPMLRSHMGHSMTSGISPGQLKQLVNIVGMNAGVKKGEAAKTILSEVFKSKGLDTDVNSNVPLAVDSTFKPILNDKGEELQLVFPKGGKITNNNFNGTAWLQQLITVDTLFNTSVGHVTFEPGARTRWHRHSGGQILLVYGRKRLCAGAWQTYPADSKRRCD
jgi:alkylhydroperoxidase/carboxymuconolactone decarboxylase family protein YurZ